MEKGNLKNIVVLKNLPSNLVDEAIVILKPNKKIKKLEVIDKNKNTKAFNKGNAIDDYILKEAEMLVANYISKIEDKQRNTNPSEDFKKKYKRLKKYSLLLSLVLIISLFVNFIL